MFDALKQTATVIGPSLFEIGPDIHCFFQVREQLKMKNNNNNDEPKKVADKMYVKEWLHENARRPVKVRNEMKDLLNLVEEQMNE